MAPPGPGGRSSGRSCRCSTTSTGRWPRLRSPGADPAFRTGVELIHRNFLAALERLGVRPFVAVGQPFDPTRHEAVSRVERATWTTRRSSAEALRGYLFQDRVLRPAQVVVAVHPAAAAAGGEGAA